MNTSNLCTPAFLYFIISFLYLIFTSFANFNIMNIIIKLFFIVLWSLLLNFLCTNGLSIIAWIMVIIPFFILI